VVEGGEPVRRTRLEDRAATTTPPRAATHPEDAAARDRLPQALRERLGRPRYEVVPLDGIEDAVLAHVPPDVKITVTASPGKGLEPTLSLAERLVQAGYAVVPHLSARLVRDRSHLEEIVRRLRAAGVRELFVPAGDAREPAGSFPEAAALLRAMGEMRDEFAEIGITGYPESHHLIPDEDTIQAMFEKAPMATCIISQICFDADVIATWIARVRARGTDLPIWIGLPGIVDYAKLLRISMQIGLGESTRFLNRHRAWMRRLVTRQFKPDAIMRDLAPCLVDATANVAGFHLYTFNEVARTERWRREMLERLADPA
jgi:methylenetetrahydrofolate reductase (NADPH)